MSSLKTIETKKDSRITKPLSSNFSDYSVTVVYDESWLAHNLMHIFEAPFCACSMFWRNTDFSLNKSLLKCLCVPTFKFSFPAKVKVNIKQ